jgi:hypothetical protein
VFPEEMSCRRYEEQQKHHSYKTGTWNVRSLNQGGKLESLKTKKRKKHLSVLGVSEVRWKGQGEIRRGDYTVFYSGGERSERGVAMVVYKSIVRSAVKKIVMTESFFLS